MIHLAYASFGRPAPENLRGPQAALRWLLCALFVVSGLLATVLLNTFALFFGVTLTFLGQSGLKVRFHRLFRGRLPIIAVTLPLLLGYEFWHQAVNFGVLQTVLPALATSVLAVVLIAATILINGRLRSA